MPRPRTMKFLHTFYLVLIAVLVTLLVVERQDQHDNMAASGQVFTEQLEVMQLALAESMNDLQENLQAELSEVRASLERVTQHEADYPRTRPASAEQPPLDRLPGSDITGDEQNIDHAQSNQVTEQSPLTSRDYARLGAAITDDFNARHELFEMQSVDPDWAYPTRERIESLFYQHDYLRELPLIDVDCRSSICRIDLSEPEPLTVNPARLLQALSGLNTNPENEQYQLISQPQEFGYRIYIERVD